MLAMKMSCQFWANSVSSLTVFLLTMNRQSELHLDTLPYYYVILLMVQARKITKNELYMIFFSIIWPVQRNHFLEHLSAENSWWPS